MEGSDAREADLPKNGPRASVFEVPNEVSEVDYGGEETVLQKE